MYSKLIDFMIQLILLINFIDVLISFRNDNFPLICKISFGRFYQMYILPIDLYDDQLILWIRYNNSHLYFRKLIYIDFNSVSDCILRVTFIT